MMGFVMTDTAESLPRFQTSLQLRITLRLKRRQLELKQLVDLISRISNATLGCRRTTSQCLMWSPWKMLNQHQSLPLFTLLCLLCPPPPPSLTQTLKYGHRSLLSLRDLHSSRHQPWRLRLAGIRALLWNRTILLRLQLCQTLHGAPVGAL